MSPLLAAGILGCVPTVSTLAPPVISRSQSVATVATATWSNESDQATQIEVSLDGDLWLTTASEKPARRHIVDLVGLHPNKDWTARVVNDGGEVSEPTEFSTAGLPADFPAWTTEGEPQWSGYMASSTIGNNACAFIMDEAGIPVWYHFGEPDQMIIRNRPRLDGKGVLYGQTFAEESSGTPSIRWVNWDGTIERQLEIPDFTHDFVELPDGSLVVILNDLRRVEGVDPRVWGNAIVRVTPEGDQQELWNTWDNWVPGIDGEIQETGWWTHANAMDLNADATEVTVGFRDLSTFIKIDIATGERIWQLGGTQSEYRYMNRRDEPVLQHQFQWVGEELLVFDNRDNALGSRVSTFTFNDEGGTVRKSGDWRHPEGLWSYILGDVHRRPDGGMLVTFTTAGIISEVDTEGNVAWQLTGALGTTASYLTATDALAGVVRNR